MTDQYIKRIKELEETALRYQAYKNKQKRNP